MTGCSLRTPLRPSPNDPERSRTVIELAYLSDLTHTEIAEQTSLPLGTVKSDIRRGLASIRRHLETSHD